MIIGFYKVKIAISSLYILYIFPSTFSFDCWLWYVYLFRFFWRLPWILPSNQTIENVFEPFGFIGSAISMGIVFSVFFSDFKISDSSCPLELKYLAIFDILVTFLFICGCLGMYIYIACTYNRYHQTNSHYLASYPDEMTSERSHYMIEILDTVIQALDVIIFSNKIDTNNWSQSDTRCAICLSEFEENDILFKLKCNHVDHKSCVTDWFRMSLSHAHCPRCRQKIVDID